MTSKANNTNAKGAMVPAEGKATEGIGKWTPAELEAQGFHFTRDLVLDENQTVQGRLVGPGTEAEIQDPGTGEIRTVPTWLLRAGPVTFRILGSAMLDRLLRDVTRAAGADAEVSITRLGQVETRKGRRMTDYAIGVRETRAE